MKVLPAGCMTAVRLAARSGRLGKTSATPAEALTLPVGAEDDRRAIACWNRLNPRYAGLRPGEVELTFLTVYRDV